MGEHVHLKIHAAIKVLHTRLTKEDLETLLTEAQTIGRLEHPHIVRAFDFDTDENGSPFLVMGYAPNGTLRQRHPKGVRLPLSTIVTYVKQVVDALQHAHDEKVIHRDIKPENMLIGRYNEILLSDFDIAVVAHSTPSQKIEDVIGTVAYMAPEQLQGESRRASDQYALGVVVYEWTTGTRPFNGSYIEIATQHALTPPPPLHAKVPEISSSVEQVVLAALAKDPHQRFASVRAFAIALEQAYQPRPQGTTLYSHWPKEQVWAVAWSPNGTRIACASLHEVQIWDALIWQLLSTYPRGADDIAWSPDSTRIATPTQVWDAFDGTQLCTYPGHSSVAWSPDGKYIASGSDDHTVQVWDATTGEHFYTYRGHSGSMKALAWSPDSTRIVSYNDFGDRAVRTIIVWQAL